MNNLHQDIPDINAWLAALRASGHTPKPEGEGWRCSCPGPKHDNGNRKNPALSIAEGKDGTVLVTCHAGCTFDEIRSAIMPTPERRYHRTEPSRDEESWRYADATGATVLTVHRRDLPGRAKDVWRSPKGAKPPRHGWPMLDLPSIRADLDKPLLVVEGERTAVHATHLFGDRYICTTAVGGAGKARQTDWSPCHGRNIVIWPDNDESGFKHARDVDMLARDAGAKSIRVISEQELSGLPDKWDVADLPPAGVDIEALLKTGTPVVSLPGKSLHSFIPPSIAWNEGTIDGMTMLNAGELLDEELPETRWILDEMLNVGGVGIISGEPKSGKSTFCRALAFSVARGTEFLGRGVSQGRVVYLAHEDIPHQTQEHFAGMGMTADDPLKYLRGYADDPKQTIDMVGTLITGNEVRLVILDPFAGSLQVDDGNDYFEVYEIMRKLRPLAMETGAHILAVHHDNKNADAKGQQKVLGSTGFTAGPDTVLFFGTTQGGRTLAGTRRDGGPLEKIILDLDDAGMVHVQGTAWERRAAELEIRIIEYLNDRTDPAKTGDIRDAVGGKAQDLSTVLSTMVMSGKICMFPKGTAKLYTGNDRNPRISTT